MDTAMATVTVMAQTKKNDWRLQGASMTLIKPTLAVFVGIMVAWAAWSNALGNVMMWRQPETALGTVGLGDYPAARLVEIQMIKSPRSFNSQALADLARGSLRTQPVNSTALRLLATASKTSGDERTFRKSGC